MSNIITNTTNLKALLDKANALPEVVTLPTLTTPGDADALLEGLELIDADGNIVTGAMPLNTSEAYKISTVDDIYNILKGYHNGDGNVGIAEEEIAKIIASNIKAGISILGVTGTYSGSGSLPAAISALKTGTFTPSSDLTSNRAIAHGLGTTPNFFLIYPTADSIDAVDFSGYNALQMFLAKPHTEYNASSEAIDYTGIFNRTYGYAYTGTSTTTAKNYFLTAIINVSTKSSYVTASYIYAQANAAYKLKAGITYRWIAGVFSGV